MLTENGKPQPSSDDSSSFIENDKNSKHKSHKKHKHKHNKNKKHDDDSIDAA